MVGMIKAKRVSLGGILWVVWIDVFFFQRPFPHSSHLIFRRIVYYSYDSDIAAIDISRFWWLMWLPLASLFVGAWEATRCQLIAMALCAGLGLGLDGPILWAPCITPHIGQRTLAAALLARRTQILVAMPESLAVSFLVVQWTTAVGLKLNILSRDNTNIFPSAKPAACWAVAAR